MKFSKKVEEPKEPVSRVWFEEKAQLIMMIIRLKNRVKTQRKYRDIFLRGPGILVNFHSLAKVLDVTRSDV